VCVVFSHLLAAAKEKDSNQNQTTFLSFKTTFFLTMRRDHMHRTIRQALCIVSWHTCTDAIVVEYSLLPTTISLFIMCSEEGLIEDERLLDLELKYPLKRAQVNAVMGSHCNATATASPQKQSDALLLLGGRRHDASAAASTSSRTKYLLFVFTTLALVVPYCKEMILGELGRADALTNAAYIHHGRPDLVTVDAGPNPKRIAPFDPTDKFSFVHISKCAGSTWISLFKEVLKLNICPEKEAGVEESVSYQQQYTCRDANYTLISLRSPRHHVWSQFTMCKYSRWGKRVTRKSDDFPRSGDKYEDDKVDFDSWLAHFTVNNTHYYNCYHPANFQSRALTSDRRDVHSGRRGLNPNMTLAMNTYKDLDFVALVEFVHESQCMLYHRLGDKAPPAAISYLSKSCHCEKQHEDHRTKDTVHIQHHSMGKRSNLRDLPPSTLSKVANLTSADSIIYVNALKNFMDEMAWLESNDALGRRVVCDNVLKKWEPELAYLDSERAVYNIVISSALYVAGAVRDEVIFRT
jgi:hypothetical protein